MNTPRRFVAFGKTPPPGEYDKRPFEGDVNKWCHDEGRGFWSLVRGAHAMWIVVEATGHTVSNWEKTKSKVPQPTSSDEILVVIPREDMTLLDDESTYPTIDHVPDIPLPACRFEVWTRKEE